MPNTFAYIMLFSWPVVVFILFPIVGGILGALVWRALVPAEDA